MTETVDKGKCAELACFHCRKSLVGTRYIVHQANNYCVPCYENEYSNTCDACHKLIGTDCKDLAYKDRHWHENCFVCCECNAHLLEKMFAYKEDKLYCSECFERVRSLGCAACGLPFEVGTKKYEHRGRRWHEECFKCHDCRNFIGNAPFIHYRNNPVCLLCYDNKYALHCAKCQKVISMGGILFKETPWHMECFVCFGCDKQLAGDKFTTNENKQFCLDCYNRLFSDRCTKCRQMITGLGIVKFISFEHNRWHLACFSCNRCNKDLVSQGFVFRNNEIYCSDCCRKIPE